VDEGSEWPALQSWTATGMPLSLERFLECNYKSWQSNPLTSQKAEQLCQFL
jgi:hypothetical protein